jgi:hypothetical protein
MRGLAAAMLLASGLALPGCATQSGGVSMCVACVVNASDNSQHKQEAKPDSPAASIASAIVKGLVAR